jgi:hypothetical protein
VRRAGQSSLEGRRRRGIYGLHHTPPRNFKVTHQTSPTFLFSKEVFQACRNLEPILQHHCFHTVLHQRHLNRTDNVSADSGESTLQFFKNACSNRTVQGGTAQYRVLFAPVLRICDRGADFHVLLVWK